MIATGLDGDGVAELVTEIADLLSIGDQVGGPRNTVNTDAFGCQTGRDLVAHDVDCVGARADECDPHLGDRLGEIAVLRKEAVTRMYCVCAGALDDIEQLCGVDIRLGGSLSAKRKSFICQAHVKRVPVEI